LVALLSGSAANPVTFKLAFGHAAGIRVFRRDFRAAWHFWFAANRLARLRLARIALRLAGIRRAGLELAARLALGFAGLAALRLAGIALRLTGVTLRLAWLRCAGFELAAWLALGLAGLTALRCTLAAAIPSLERINLSLIIGLGAGTAHQHKADQSQNR
jgi:hypothetical protein